jgi:hypothetical protein
MIAEAMPPLSPHIFTASPPDFIIDKSAIIVDIAARFHDADIFSHFRHFQLLIAHAAISLSLSPAAARLTPMMKAFDIAAFAPPLRFHC